MVIGCARAVLHQQAQSVRSASDFQLHGEAYMQTTQCVEQVLLERLSISMLCSACLISAREEKMSAYLLLVLRGR